MPLAMLAPRRPFTSSRTPTAGTSDIAISGLPPSGCSPLGNLDEVSRAVAACRSRPAPFACSSWQNPANGNLSAWCDHPADLPYPKIDDNSPQSTVSKNL